MVHKESGNQPQNDIMLLKKLVEEVYNELMKKEALKSQQKSNELLTRKQTAEFFNISYFTLHEWVKKGILTPHKVSGRTYFLRSDIDKMLKAS